MAFLWVPIIGDGTARTGDDMPKDVGPFRPDVPEGVAWTAALPVEIRRGHPKLGHPVVTHCRIEVPDEDVAKIANAVTPCGRDEAIVELWSTRRSAINNRVIDKADAHARVKALRANGVSNDDIDDALEEAKLRGLTSGAADAIRQAEKLTGKAVLS